MDSGPWPPLAFSHVTTPQDDNDPVRPMPAWEPAGPVKPAEPREVRTSFWLWIAGAVLLALSSLLVLTQQDAAVEAARNSPGGTQGLTEEQFQAAVKATLVLVTGVGVVLGLLMAFFAFRLRAGRTWARVALTILGAVVFVYHLIGFSLVGLLIVLVVGAAIVTLYLPNSKAYFDSLKRVG